MNSLNNISWNKVTAVVDSDQLIGRKSVSTVSQREQTTDRNPVGVVDDVTTQVSHQNERLNSTLGWGASEKVCAKVLIRQALSIKAIRTITSIVEENHFEWSSSAYSRLRWCCITVQDTWGWLTVGFNIEDTRFWNSGKICWSLSGRSAGTRRWLRRGHL